MEKSITLWLVEDDYDYQASFIEMVTAEPGLHCPHWLASLDELKLILEKTTVVPPQVVLMDVGLQERSGIEGVGMVKAHFPQVPVLMLTINDSTETIFKALKAGASGYLLKDMPWNQTVAAIHEAERGGMLMSRTVAEKVMSYFKEHVSVSSYQLTARELEVLRCMTEGMTYKGIAKKLTISPHTSGNHIRNIYKKLHVHSAAEAVSTAIREGIV